MRLHSKTARGELSRWLHLILVAGVLVYLYSPLLDHLLDKDVYARPHTHIHVAGGVPQQLQSHEGESAASGHLDHEAHEEGVLCMLNIDALLSLWLSMLIVADTLPAPQEPLAASLAATCLDVSLIYLSSLDPPPNI